MLHSLLVSYSYPFLFALVERLEVFATDDSDSYNLSSGFGLFSFIWIEGANIQQSS